MTIFNEQLPEAAAGMLQAGAPLIALLLCCVIAFVALRFLFQCLAALVKLTILGALFFLLVQFAAIPQPSADFLNLLAEAEGKLSRFAPAIPGDWAHMSELFAHAKERSVSELGFLEDVAATITLPES